MKILMDKLMRRIATKKFKGYVRQLGRYNLFVMHIFTSSVFGQSRYRIILDRIKHCCKVISEECCTYLNVKEQPYKNILFNEKILENEQDTTEL